ncbi:multidrug resistance protein [Alicyclobacillus hesperidum subsp. aegles]|uniref:MFS transporter n=1 Tax=Alicyclobacillus hesperidum TaxID=89784 RepID=UPI00222D8464|nr:MFS transporter [Alicyclobacillus hesperidum]GLG02694.1 multidrug resistance protein [Alicyclobacillus hesperidum subsp. aegles]
MQVSKRWGIVSIATIPLIITLGNAMMIPVLPILQRQLHINAVQSSLVITAYSIIAIVLIPVAGFISDRVGRKRVILPALGVTAAGGLIAGMGASLLHSYGWILAGRFIQGAGSAGAMPIAMPLVGDMLKRDEDVSKALGTIETSNTLGKVLSPILGAALAMWVFSLPFYAIPVLCLISGSMVALCVRVPKHDAEKPPHPVRVAVLLSLLRKHLRWLSAVFVMGASAMFVLFGTLVYLSDRLESTWNLDGILKGLVLAVPLCCLCLTSYLVGHIISDRARRMKYATVGGGFVACGGSVSGAMVPGAFSLAMSVCVIGIGIGAVLPAVDALITESIDKEQRGSITSVYTSTRFLGVAAGPFTVSLLSALGQVWVFGLMASLCLLAALYSMWAIKVGADGHGRTKMMQSGASRRPIRVKGMP